MSASETELQNMVKMFRVCDLQHVLKCARINKYGKKNELQKRALALIKLNSLHIKMKIIELYEKNYQSQCSVSAKECPLAPISDPMGSNSDTSNHKTPQVNHQMEVSGCGIYQNPEKPAVTFKDLPFYDVLSELLNPISLVPSQNNGYVQEKTLYFYFGIQDLQQLKSSSDVQVLLRIGSLVTNCELEDDFPTSVSIKINYKEMFPNVMSIDITNNDIKPIDITRNMKINIVDPQYVCVSWPCSNIKSYMIGVFLVRNQTSNVLMKCLKDNNVRNPDYTTAMIKEKLCHEWDSEIAAMSLRGSLICPLGKNKMMLPCRAVNCTHLQCFDAHLFIQMNEKNPKWICPVCNKPAVFNSLIIDGLFLKIINESPSECTEVQFHENGSWTPVIPVKKIAKIQEITIKEFTPKIGEQKKSVEIINITDSYTEDIVLDVTKTPSECTEVQFHENGSWTPVIPVKKVVTKIQEIAIQEITPKIGEQKKADEIINISDSNTEDIILVSVKTPSNCTEVQFYENGTWTSVNPVKELAEIQEITIPAVTPSVGEHKKPIEIINLNDSYTDNLSLGITEDFSECTDVQFHENKSCSPVNPLNKVAEILETTFKENILTIEKQKKPVEIICLI